MYSQSQIRQISLKFLHVGLICFTHMLNDPYKLLQLNTPQLLTEPPAVLPCSSPFHTSHFNAFPLPTHRLETSRLHLHQKYIIQNKVLEG